MRRHLGRQRHMLGTEHTWSVGRWVGDGFLRHRAPFLQRLQPTQRNRRRHGGSLAHVCPHLGRQRHVLGTQPRGSTWRRLDEQFLVSRCSSHIVEQLQPTQRNRRHLGGKPPHVCPHLGRQRHVLGAQLLRTTRQRHPKRRHIVFIADQRAHILQQFEPTQRHHEDCCRW